MTVQKWDQAQCSYCGGRNVQFVCWRCHQSDVEDLREEISQIKKTLNELVVMLSRNSLADSKVLETLKVKE